MVLRSRSLVLIAVFAIPFVTTAPAAAQPYVGAAFVTDVVRTSGATDDSAGNGEALGGALRLGVPLTEHWGVDIAFSRTGDIDWEPDVTILRALEFVNPVLPDLAIFPTPQVASRSQLSIISTTAWWRQEITDRFNLVYHGGAAFARTAFETNVEYRPAAVPVRPGISPVFPEGFRLYSQESVSYDTGVVVGIEGDIEMTDHLRLVPGMRLTAVASRWILQPAVGLHWRF